MPQFRVSISGLLVLVALFALALAPLTTPTWAFIATTIYLKFAIVVVATFLSRSEDRRAASWWFGFATLGWASILISVPGFWAGVNDLMIAPGLNLVNLSGSLADWLEGEIGPGRLGLGTGGLSMRLRYFVETWFTIVSSLCGGSISLLLERRRRQGAGRAERAIPDLPSPR